MNLVYDYLDLASVQGSDELTMLEELFAEYGAALPDPLKSKLYVVRDQEQEGKIVGFYCLQVRLHAEPMWIQEEYRGRLDNENGLPIWFNLVMGIEQFTRQDDTFIVAENEITDEMCRLMNLELVKHNVYVKRKQS
jgi:hypothetical protein